MGAKGTFQQSSRKRILVSSDPRWIHRILVVEEATCHSSIMFQCIEYRREREYDASEGVNVEDPEARHGTTRWIDY